MKPSPKLLLILLICLTLATIVVLGIALFSMAPTLASSKSMRTAVDIQLLTEALEKYKQQNGSYPPTEPGLQSIGIDPPRDAWGTRYVYRSPGKRHSNTYDLFSPGEDRIPDTVDDDWNNTPPKVRKTEKPRTPAENEILLGMLLSISMAAGLAGGLFSVRCFHAKTWGKRILAFLPVFCIVGIEIFIIALSVVVLTLPAP